MNEDRIVNTDTNSEKKLDVKRKMPLLPFEIESINVVNTGLDDCEVEGVNWINGKRIRIANKVECVYDDGFGGTCVASNDEFDWDFKERGFVNDAYVLIKLKK